LIMATFCRWGAIFIWEEDTWRVGGALRQINVR